MSVSALTGNYSLSYPSLSNSFTTSCDILNSVDPFPVAGGRGKLRVKINFQDFATVVMFSVHGGYTSNPYAGTTGWHYLPNTLEVIGAAPVVINYLPGQTPTVTGTQNMTIPIEVDGTDQFDLYFPAITPSPYLPATQKTITHSVGAPCVLPVIVTITSESSLY